MTDSKCAVFDCDKGVEKREWCNRHYRRWMRHGDPTGVAERPSFEARFWSKVDRSGGTDACWPWTARSRTKFGYGVIGRGGRGEGMEGAHRVAYELANGPIPNGLFVLHKCDNPPCCNPAHLFVGTNADNLRDMAAKGRHYSVTNPARIPRGERHGNAALTESMVREIRCAYAAGERIRYIARRLGLGESAVDHVVHRRSWAHVE